MPEDAMIKQFYIVLFTGDRNWTNQKSVQRVLEALRFEFGNRLGVVSGGASGLDSIVEALCHEQGIPFARVDAQWDFYLKAAGPIRNKWMLQFFHVQEVHAFHPNIKQSKGTRNMVEQAKQNGLVPVIHAR